MFNDFFSVEGFPSHSAPLCHYMTLIGLLNIILILHCKCVVPLSLWEWTLSHFISRTWLSAPPAPPWLSALHWLSAPPVSPWLSDPPALPQSPVPLLPHGPSPPSLPLFRICSTSLLDSSSGLFMLRSIWKPV